MRILLSVEFRGNTEICCQLLQQQGQLPLKKKERKGRKQKNDWLVQNSVLWVSYTDEKSLTVLTVPLAYVCSSSWFWGWFSGWCRLFSVSTSILHLCQIKWCCNGKLLLMEILMQSQIAFSHNNLVITSGLTVWNDSGDKIGFIGKSEAFDLVCVVFFREA